MTRIPFALALLAAAASGIRAQTVDGTWRSEGYGWVLDIRGDSLRAREVTAVSCIDSFRAHREATVPAGAVAAFTFDASPTTIQVLRGTSGDVMRLHLEGSASDYIIRRASAPPAICDRETAKDAQTTFDVLWQNYADHYPFFALKQVDWNAVRATYRPRAAAASPEELFEIFRSMIEPLHDAHTFLVASDINKRTGGRRPDPDSIGVTGRPRIEEIITTKYLRSPPRTWAQGRVSFGYLPDSIGYLRITAFAGYTREGSFRSMLAALESALDTVFADTRGWRGLVIDVRVNGGGADPLGLAIASRLTATPYTAYAKVARSDPRDPTKMTARQASVVSPSSRPGWRGPVVELTSRYSVSAAETFTQALMGRRPAIARVGENTQGVFSDVLGRTLPNGWRIGLPNELFLTEQGTSFDGPGIPPTVSVPTFTKADLATGRDPGLERAMALLRGPSGSSPRFAAHDVATDLRGGYQVVVSDLNRDGKPDLIAVASNLPELLWFENPSWTRHVLAGGFTGLINAAAADLDADGIPEIAVASGFSTRPDQSAGIVALLTHGADPTQPWTVREIDRAPAAHRLRWYTDKGGQRWLVNSPLAGATAAQPPNYDGTTPIFVYRAPDWKREPVVSDEFGVVHAIEPIHAPFCDACLLSAGFAGIHRYEHAGGVWTHAAIATGDPAAVPKGGE